MRAAMLIASLAFLGLAVPFAAQGAEPQALRTAPGKAVRVGFFAVFPKGCSASPAPQIRVSGRQAHGVVHVQGALLATDKVPNCPEIKFPAQLVFYQPNPGFTGSESVRFTVVDPATGRSQNHAVAITVQQGPAR